MTSTFKLNISFAYKKTGHAPKPIFTFTTETTSW